MSQLDPQPAALADWRKLHAFGWPAGSVRALMALIVFGCLWVFLVLRPDQEVPEYLKDLLFIILGHYFAVRGRQDPGQEAGPPPLYLPRGSVRFILVAGFLVTGVLLYRQGRLIDIGHNPAVVTLFLVCGFILGVTVQQVWARLAGQGTSSPSTPGRCAGPGLARGDDLPGRAGRWTSSPPTWCTSACRKSTSAWARSACPTSRRRWSGSTSARRS